MWSEQYYATQAGRFQGVLTSLVNKGFSYETDWLKAKEEPQFAERIGKINIGSGNNCISVAAARDGQAALGECFGNSLTSVRVAGNDDRDQVRMYGFQRLMDIADKNFLARVGARSEPTRPGSNVISQEV